MGKISKKFFRVAACPPFFRRVSLVSKYIVIAVHTLFRDSRQDCGICSTSDYEWWLVDCLARLLLLTKWYLAVAVVVVADCSLGSQWLQNLPEFV